MNEPEKTIETPEREGDCSPAICSPYEVLGWAIAECCAILDKGDDPRQVNMGDFIERYENDFRANVERDDSE